MDSDERRNRKLHNFNWEFNILLSSAHRNARYERSEQQSQPQDLIDIYKYSF